MISASRHERAPARNGRLTRGGGAHEDDPNCCRNCNTRGTSADSCCQAQDNTVSIEIRSKDLRREQGLFDQREFGVLGSRWSGNTLTVDPIVVLHLIIGGVPE